MHTGAGCFRDYSGPDSVASHLHVNMKVCGMHCSDFQPVRRYAPMRMRKASGANDKHAADVNRQLSISMREIKKPKTPEALSTT